MILGSTTTGTEGGDWQTKMPMSPVTGVKCPAQGSWEAWCDCMWPASRDPVSNFKCKCKQGTAAFAPPWTGYGAVHRGIPALNDKEAQISGFIGTIATGIGSVFGIKAAGACDVPQHVLAQAQQIAQGQQGRGLGLSIGRLPSWAAPVGIAVAGLVVLYFAFGRSQAA